MAAGLLVAWGAASDWSDTEVTDDASTEEARDRIELPAEDS